MQKRGAALASALAGLALLQLACAVPAPSMSAGPGDRTVAAPPAAAEEEEDEKEEAPAAPGKEAASEEDDEDEEAGKGEPKAPDKPPPPLSSGRGDGGVTVAPTASLVNVRVACQRLLIALATTRNRQVQQSILGAMADLGCAASPTAPLVLGPGLPGLPLARPHAKPGTRDHRRR